SHAGAMGYKTAQIGNVLFICHTSNATFSNVIVRNNSFYGAGGPGGLTWQEDLGVTGCTWGPGNIVTGNIFTTAGNCSRAGSVSKNIILAPSGTGCGFDSALGASVAPYVDGANYDFDLNPAKAGVALNFVPPATGYPATDIYGVARSAQADAGGNEVP